MDENSNMCLPKGSGKPSKVREKSVKSQGILKRILSGNPVNSSLAAVLESQPLARRKQTVAASGYIYCSASRLVLAVTGY